jgi:hypothetical protein
MFLAWPSTGKSGSPSSILIQPSPAPELPAAVPAAPSVAFVARSAASARPRSSCLFNQHPDQHRTTNQCKGRVISVIHARELMNVSPAESVRLLRTAVHALAPQLVARCLGRGQAGVDVLLHCLPEPRLLDEGQQRDPLPASVAPSIFRDKNTRRIGKSQSNRQVAGRNGRRTCHFLFWPLGSRAKEGG